MGARFCVYIIYCVCVLCVSRDILAYCDHVREFVPKESIYEPGKGKPCTTMGGIAMKIDDDICLQ